MNIFSIFQIVLLAVLCQIVLSQTQSQNNQFTYSSNRPTMNNNQFNNNNNQGFNNNNNRTVYKLTYFNARARGEFLRWMFAVANVSFQDNRIEMSTWPQLKPSFMSTLFGQLPVLEVIEDQRTSISQISRNTTIAQSASIARFLAGRFNMQGRTEYDAAYAGMYSEQLNDILNEYAQLFLANNVTGLMSFVNGPLRNYLKVFNDRLSANYGYLAGTDYTYADLRLIATLDLMPDMERNMMLRMFQNIGALDNRVRRIPAIRDWINKRPKTEF